eukprot:jgi/Psemu1/3141/gm1.3141_g
MPVTADTIKHFWNDTIDDANIYAEQQKRKFNISATAYELDRTKANTSGWIDRQKRELERATNKTKHRLGVETNNDALTNPYRT